MNDLGTLPQQYVATQQKYMYAPLEAMHPYVVFVLQNTSSYY